MSVKGKYDVMAVSRYIIKQCNEQGIQIDNLKLQKLLYLVQAAFLLDSDGEEACFNEELYAWAYGPVVPEAYTVFKNFGSSNIPIEFIEEYQTLHRVGERFVFKREKFDPTSIAQKDRAIIDTVLEIFKEYSSIRLVKMTHAQDPWKDVYDPNLRNIVITKESIYRYFSSLN